MTQSEPDAGWSWLLVIQLYVAQATIGAVQILGRESVGYYWLLQVFSGSVAASWVVLDVRGRQSKFHIPRVLLLLFWPLAVPLYLIWSRGWQGLVWVLAHWVGLSAVAWLGLWLATIAA